jgi:hypothetical protein
MSEYRRCNKCEILQELTDFHKDKAKLGGRNTICKKCRNKSAIRGIDPVDVCFSVKKIECLRGEPHMIFAKHCIPGCNDACVPCKNKQINNIQAINVTSPEEDRELNYTSSFGNSGAMAAAEGNYSL